MPIRHLTPAPVWQWFADICTIPHPTYREAELAAHGIALSTGGVRAGDLFVAAAGASTHGARFAADALAAGAALARHPWHGR